MRTVTRLSLTPVKSLALHHPAHVRLDRHGAEGDRRFHLLREDGRLLAGLHHGPLVRVTGEWDPDGDVLALRFPDGALLRAEVRTGEAVTTDFWGRPVRGRVVLGPWAEALSAFAGERVRLVKADEPAGAVDTEPLTIVSAASVAELARRAGRTHVDARRFRMLLELAGCTPHEEDSWAGRRVRIGGAVVEVAGPVPRCATTTHDPSTGIRDLDTLRVLAEYRGLRDGTHIDFGVYARVVEPGEVRVGDAVEPLP